VNRLETGKAKTEAEVFPSDILAMLPCGSRFRFLDEILEIGGIHVVARYRFREDDFFYPGHFPERAVTPGTILLEAMCQCGLTAQSYYLLARELSIETARDYRILFTGAQVEWFEQTGPGSVITLRSELLAWRRHRIRARVKVFDEQNRLVAESELSGMGVLLKPESSVEEGTTSGNEGFARPERTIMGGTRHES
jgi:3-hydroxyacyl-[acyl-carrier-protein] dehydratase